MFVRINYPCSTREADQQTGKLQALDVLGCFAGMNARLDRESSSSTSVRASVVSFPRKPEALATSPGFDNEITTTHPCGSGQSMLSINWTILRAGTLPGFHIC